MNRDISWRRRRFALVLRTCTVEALEDRRLLTAAAEFSAGDLFSQLAIDRSAYREASLLVQFRPGASAAAIEAAEFAGTEIGQAWEIAPGLHEVDLDAGTDFLAALAAYKENPDVLFVEPDFRVALNVAPNDPSLGALWGLDNTGQTGGAPDADVDALEAWDVTQGSTAVAVGVIDTGIDYDHPDLYRNIWINQDEIPSAIKANLTDIDGDGLITFWDLNNSVNQGPGKIADHNADGRIDGGDLLHAASGWENGQDNDSDGKIDDLIGWNFVTNTNDPRDDHFHGTHVAGTIGAVGNNGVGVVGMNWTVQLAGLKFLDSSGGGYISDALDALNFAVANGIGISNNSWGGGGFSAAFQTALVNAAAAGHIFVAAAGNEGSNNDFTPFFPANYDVDNVVSVAASDHNDDLASFSNFGSSTVDLSAPGVNIYSTFPTYVTPAMSSYNLPANYGTISGTSMATPHVSGALALIRAAHLTWTYDQVITQLLNTVDVVSSLSQTITGGRLNAAAAVGNPPPDTTGPSVISSSPSGGVSGSVSQVRLRFSEPINAGTFGTIDVVSFTGPAGAIVVTNVLPVPGSSRQFDVTFQAQTLQGAYSLVVGPDIHDLAGNAMAAPYTASFSIVDTLVIHSTDVPAPIFDWVGTGSYLTVNENVTIADLNVQLNITHTYVGDLLIYIEAPSGNYTYLSYFYGGSGNNFQDTIFDDEASTPIWDGFAPFAGSYQPDTPLSVFDGENARGTWTLWIWDMADFDEGTLNAWSIEITPEGSSPPPPPPPPPPGNQPPVAYDDYATTDEEVAVSVDPLAANGNPADFDPDGDPLTVVSVGGAFGGSAVLNGDGTVTFTPAVDFSSDLSGPAHFNYTISDGQGGTDSAVFYLDVLPINDPPVAVDDSAIAIRNTPLELDAADLLANDNDVDGDDLSFAGFVDESNPGNHGTAVYDPATGIITFTPEADYLGPAKFAYAVSDGTTSDVAQVNIDVREVYYFSTAANGTLTGSDGVSLSFGDEDIIQLSLSPGGAYSYSLYFDGSDVGLTTSSEDIDAFAILPDGTIVVSTVGSYSVGGLSGNGNNLLAFSPLTLGQNTTGTWSLFLQGSSVGLANTSAENIDAVAVLEEAGSTVVVISTTGNVSVPGISGVDADLLRYNYNFNTWQMYFDASDVGLTTSNEDVDGLFIRETPGLPQLYLSTRGNFAVSGVSGANEDVLGFTPTQLGGTTAGGFSLVLDGSLYGLAAHDLDGIYVGLAPNQDLVGGAAVAGVGSAGSDAGFSGSGASAKAAALESSAPEDTLVARDFFFQRLAEDLLAPRGAISAPPASAPRFIPQSPASHPEAVARLLSDWVAARRPSPENELSLARPKPASDDGATEDLGLAELAVWRRHD